MIYVKWPDNFPKPADQEWSGETRQTTWKTGPLALVFGDKEQHIVGQRILMEWWRMAIEKGYEGEAKTSFNVEGRVAITLGKWQWVIVKDEEGWKIEGPSATVDFTKMETINEGLHSWEKLMTTYSITNDNEKAVPLDEKALTSSGLLQPNFDFTKKEEAAMGWTTKATDTDKDAVDEHLKKVVATDYIPAESFVTVDPCGVEEFKMNDFQKKVLAMMQVESKVEQAPAGPTYTISIPGVPGPAETVSCEVTRKFNLNDKLLEIKDHEQFNVRFAKYKTEYSMGKLRVFRTEIGDDEVETYSDVQQNVFLWLLRAGREGTYKMKFDSNYGWAEKVVAAVEMPCMIMTPTFHENDEWLSVNEWGEYEAGWRRYNNCKVFSQGFAGGIHDYLWANQIEGAWKTVAAQEAGYYFGARVPGNVGSVRAFGSGFVKASTTNNEIKKIARETPIFKTDMLCPAELMDAGKMWDSANSQLVDKKVAVKARNYEMNQAKLLLNYLNDKGLEGEWQLIIEKDVFWGEQYE